MIGYQDAEDKYGFVHGLGRDDDTSLEVLGVNFDGTMSMEGEKAGEFVDWEEWEKGGNGQWEGEWRENYDDENPFLTK